MTNPNINLTSTKIVYSNLADTPTIFLIVLSGDTTIPELPHSETVESKYHQRELGGHLRICGKVIFVNFTGTHLSTEMYGGYGAQCFPQISFLFFSKELEETNFRTLRHFSLTPTNNRRVTLKLQEHPDSLVYNWIRLYWKFHWSTLRANTKYKSDESRFCWR